MIPREMSFFFAGPHLSWMRWLTLASFRKLNPEWRVTLWTAGQRSGPARWTTGESQDFEFHPTGKSYWGEVESLGVEVKQWVPPLKLSDASPVHLSDFCRWHVLEQHGGWYADTDILWVRPLACLESIDCDAAIIARNDHVPIGFFGGRPGAGVFSRIAKFADREYSPARYQSAGSDAIDAMLNERRMVVSLPNAVRNRLISIFDPLRLQFLRPAFVYPWEWTQTEEIFHHVREVGLETVGIHWFGGSRPAQRFNATVGAGNFREFQNTFCHYARQVLDA